MLQDILTRLGIELNGMQEATMHAMLHSNKDVVVLSPTGSGKTLAYLLPLVQLIAPSVDAPQALVITPGRELALQSANVLATMHTPVKAMACYGGRPTMDEHRLLRKVMPHVIFGTPGRLNDHIDKGNFEIENIKYLIIDEFDKCLEMGFQNEMSKLIESLPNLERHILLSATEAEQIPNFVHMNRAETIDYRIEEEQVSDRVCIYQVDSPQKDKLETLAQLLLSFGDESTIVFLNYRDSVERTSDFLREKGFSLSSFHGGLDQKAREDALYKFSNGSVNILGPTEHIPDYVDAEIQTYEIPQTHSVPAKPRMATIYIGKGKKDKVSKGDIVGYLCKIGQLNSSEIGKIDVKDRYAYVAVSRTKLKQVLKLTAGQKIKGIRTVVEEVL